MEKLKPVVSKSSISSLKFQRKSDFDKFLNFIKKQTKELKGIEKPKDDRLKSILKTGAIGLGIIGIGALLGRGKQGKSGDDFGFAIGRRSNKPSTKLKTLPSSTPKPDPKPSKAAFRAGKRTFSQRGKTPERLGGRKEATRLRKTIVRGGLVTSKGLTESEALVEAGGDSGTRKTAKSQTIIEPKPNEIEKSKKLINRKKLSQRAFGKFLKDKNFRSDINKAANMATVDQFQKESFRNIKKKLRDIDKNEGAIKEFNRVKTKGRNAKTGMGADYSNTSQPTGNKKRYRGRVKIKDKVLRSGVRGFSNPDPFNRFGTVSNPLMSKNPYKKGFLSNIFKSKVTRDTIMGIPTKGKFFTKAGMFFKHPIVSGISFLLTLYEGYREGKDIVNFKDNIITRIYDLGVAINNELIHPNDPSQMKLFLSESSNDKIRAKEIIRNQKILELKKQQLQQNGGNNILIVPTNNQTEGVKTTVPVPTSNNEVVIPPTKPLNIGENILLKKLDR